MNNSLASELISLCGDKVVSRAKQKKPRYIGNESTRTCGFGLDKSEIVTANIIGKEQKTKCDLWVLCVKLVVSKAKDIKPRKSKEGPSIPNIGVIKVSTSRQ